MYADQVWAVLKGGLLVSEKDVFRDNDGTLKPLLDSCNALFAHWLQSQCC